MTFFTGVIVGCFLGVAFMCLFFLASEADKHIEFAPQVPRLKNEEQLTLRGQILKAEEELHETSEAFTEYLQTGSAWHFIEECGDLYHAAGVLHRKACEELGVDPGLAWAKVVQKNRKRGLYA